MGKIKRPVIGRAVIIILCVTVAAAVFLGLRIYRQRNAKASGSVSMTFKVTRGSIKSSVSGVGTVASSDAENITAPTGSKVAGVNCTEGQIVKTGDTLFTLSNPSAEIDLQKSNLNLTQLQTQLNTLNSQLKSLTIYAPVSGIIRGVNVNVGDGVSPQGGGQSGLIEIEDTSAMKFTASLGEANGASRAGSIVLGQVAYVTFAGEGGERKSTVSSISSQSGGGITFRILNTKDLSWGGSYLLSSIKINGNTVNIDRYVQVSGDTAYVNAKQSGTVTGVYAKVGNRVSKGAKLLATSSDSLANQIRSAQLDIKSAQLEVQDRKDTVSDLTIKAPIDGTIGDIQVKVGDQIGSSSLSSSAKTSSASANAQSQSLSSASGSSGSGTTIATIQNPSLLQVQVPVDELDIAKVKAGQQASITADAISGKTFSGKVSSVASSGTVSNGSATFEVNVDISDAEGLKPGMTANVSIITASKDNTLLLPFEAVQQQNKKKFVLVKDTDGNETMKEVTLGIVNVDYAEILTGVSEGDTVIAQFKTSGTSSGNNRTGAMGGFGGMNQFGGSRANNYNRQGSQGGSAPANSFGN